MRQYGAQFRTMNDAEKRDESSRGDVLAMFDRIPVETLEKTAYELLTATRTVSMGRDREPVQEPDNQVRLRVWEAIVAHRAGAPGTRKPVEPKKETKAEANAGGLRRAK